MHSAAVARVSKGVVHYSASPHTAAAAAGSLIVQDENFVDLQVSEFLHDGNGQRSDFIDDIETVVKDLIYDSNVINFVKHRASFQSLEARLRHSSYQIDELARDVLSLSHGTASARLIAEITSEEIIDDISDHISSHSHASGARSFHARLARDWLRERISKENLEQFFQRLDSPDIKSVDGIRLSFKRASEETPGLRSLLDSRVPLSNSNISNMSDYPSPMSGRYNRRASNGNVGSPPRERSHMEIAISPPPKSVSDASDPLAPALITIATAIFLASMMKKEYSHIVDKLKELTRKITSWIASQLKRE